jgi:rhodanese-related sulfurtransferase
MIVNPSFLNEINELFGNTPDILLIIMCRSGQRSAPASAALEEAGYTVLNLNAGFQGGTDAKGYRNVNGWVNAGLPYTYSGVGYQD